MSFAAGAMHWLISIITAITSEIAHALEIALDLVIGAVVSEVQSF